MEIYVYDTTKKKDIKLSFEPSSIISADNIYVVFIDRDTYCGLQNGKNSAKYSEFYIKSVNHIIYTTVDYDGITFHFTIGCYLSDNEICPFIINQSSELGYYRFEHSSSVDENYAKESILFNYKEYSELMELGLEKLTFKEYFDKVIERQIRKEQYHLYKISDIDNKTLISEKGFTMFLDEEEKK